MRELTESSPLRCGLLVGTRTVAWQRRAVTSLLASRDVDIVAVVADAGPGTRLAHPRRLWRLYHNRLVARRARALRPASLSDLLGPDARHLAVTPERRGRWSQHFPEAALDELRRLELDVLLRFGFGILRGEVLTVARYGVWSFHHDDERVIRGGPPAFWEVYDGMATTGVLFQRLTDRLDGGVPLARATFRTVGHSYPRNRDRAALGAVELPRLVARAVRLGELDPMARPATTTDAPIRRDPTDRQMVRFFGHQARRIVTTQVRRVAVGARWGIGVGPLADVPGEHLPPVRWLPERRGGYYADPFPARRDGRTAVLVEEFDERRGRGWISALVPSGERWEPVGRVLDIDAHASYPFLFEHEGELYCTPETAQAGEVGLWRCRRFPHEWERVATLVSAPVVDPTIVHHGDRWWLFGGRRDRDANTELWLWTAPSLHGPWEPHPGNPVKIDVTSARPAGTPWVRDGVLYRPAQDCSTGYGRGLVVNRITRLDLVIFQEEADGRLELPNGPYVHGPHTLGLGGGLVTVDGQRPVADRHRARRELAARLRRRRPR